MVPAGMDSKYRDGVYRKAEDLQEQQKNAEEGVPRTSDPPIEQLSRLGRSTIRPVTPDIDHNAYGVPNPSRSLPRELGSLSVQVSPRAALSSGKSKDHRQGSAFRENFETSRSNPTTPSHKKTVSVTQAENSSPTKALSTSRQVSVFREDPEISHSNPTTPNHKKTISVSQVESSSPTQAPNTRPRTRTLDEPKRKRQTSAPVSKSRHRVGSVHSTSSIGSPIETEPLSSDQSADHTPIAPLSQSAIQNSGSVKEKLGRTRRLVKKASYTFRPSSPPPSPPDVGSLLIPVATTNANKILKLMGALNGRMRGGVEYQTSPHGPWVATICLIDEKGALINESNDSRSQHETLIPDLRGSKVRPTMSLDKQERCLEIETFNGVKIRLMPLVPNEFDHWLASFLSWQQTRSDASQVNVAIPEVVTPKWEQVTRSSSGTVIKGTAVIKVAKILLWDKSLSQSPSSIARRASRRDSRVPAVTSWRRVSCVLQDNGEFKLMTENDVILLSTIQLSQLSRCAIQQLDRSVLGEEYCIGIFPQYTPTSTALSILRPVYIGLESRVLFEVWFVLLRAFAVPEIYGPQLPVTEDKESAESQEAFGIQATSDLFRIEKSLSIRIIEAKIRPKATKMDTLAQSRGSTKSSVDSGKGDYFAEVVLDGEVRSKTTTKMDTTKPFWREDCEFSDLPAMLPELSMVLKRAGATFDGIPTASKSSTAINYSDPHLDTIVGSVQLHLDELDQGKYLENWWPILDENRETVGEMFLKLRHEELVVLLSQDYHPLSELLHRFSNGLTVQISQIIGLNLKSLSETLMNIFQVSGHAASWLMTLVEDEIDGIGKETPVTRLRFNSRVGSNDSFESVGEREQSVRDMSKSLTGEANLLFRGNSLLTQALDCHMRRVGKEYLHDVLNSHIRQINSMNPDCEVDPSRLGHVRQDELDDHWSQLIALTTTIWDSIAASSNRCPPELRQILKYIRAVAEDRYGAFLRTVPYTSVSGFLFLRFFCPALLNPKLFGLLRDHPQPRAQRTLTLIAKSLQNLANLTTFGQKELWMEPMNRFLSGHKQSVKTFIDNICSIPSERTTYAIPASYSTPITILGRLPATSREGFPSLPYLIDCPRNFAALVKIWLDSTPDYLEHSNFDGDLREFHNICLDLQRRASECLQKAENDSNPKPNDPPSAASEDQPENFNSPSLLPPLNSYTLPTHLNQNSTLRDEHSENGTLSPGAPSSAGSESAGREQKGSKGIRDAGFGKDSKHQRPGDTPAEQKQSRVGRKMSSTLNVIPPERIPSRNEKRSFLSRLAKKRDGDGERKEEKDGEVDKERDEDKERERERGRQGSGSVLVKDKGRHETLRPSESWGRL